MSFFYPVRSHFIEVKIIYTAGIRTWVSSNISAFRMPVTALPTLLDQRFEA